MQKISPEEFSEWRESHLTQVFLKYLKDSAKDEAEVLTSRIMSGEIISDLEQIRHNVTAATLEGISEIDLAEIEEFYQDD